MTIGRQNRGIKQIESSPRWCPRENDEFTGALMLRPPVTKMRLAATPYERLWLALLRKAARPCSLTTGHILAGLPQRLKRQQQYHIASDPKLAIVLGISLYENDTMVMP